MVRRCGARQYLGGVLGAAVAALTAPGAAASSPGAPIWSGVYVGMHAGYGWGDTSIRDGGTVITSGFPPFGAFSCGAALSGNYCNTPFELQPKGWLGGVHAGVNWQKGNLVVGAEGDFGRLAVADAKTLNRPLGDQDFGSVKYGWYGTLTGRLGYAANDALVYVKGGLAVADIKVRAADIDFVIYPGSLIDDSGVRTGWALGGGLEYVLGPNTALKAEYLHMNFGSDTSRSPDGDIYRHTHALHTVSVGLSFRVPPVPVQ
ncbi:MAG: porin family protein [Hyphomicrobiaceae bacterium]|nr:MAG: porin family protein [Hyphomicrobiaceae bacterium]